MGLPPGQALIGAQLRDGGLPFPGPVRRQPDRLAYGGDPRGQPPSCDGVLERERRILVDQIAGGDQVPGDALGDGAG
jgi:hypothetical protein